MRFYKVDMQGKFFTQRGTNVPGGTGPSDEGRIFYQESDETIHYHDQGGWIEVWSENNIPILASQLAADPTAVNNLSGKFLRSDTDDDNGSNRLTLGELYVGAYQMVDHTTGIIPVARLSGTYNISITGTARYG